MALSHKTAPLDELGCVAGLIEREQPLAQLLGGVEGLNQSRFSFAQKLAVKVGFSRTSPFRARGWKIRKRHNPVAPMPRGEGQLSHPMQFGGLDGRHYRTILHKSCDDPKV